MKSEIVKILQKNISLLTQKKYQEYEYIPQHFKPLPSLQTLREIVELLRAIIFPGYFGEVIADSNTLDFHLGVKIERLFGLLKEQILNGLRFNSGEHEIDDYDGLSGEIAMTFIN